MVLSMLPSLNAQKLEADDLLSPSRHGQLPRVSRRSMTTTLWPPRKTLSADISQASGRSSTSTLFPWVV